MHYPLSRRINRPLISFQLKRNFDDFISSFNYQSAYFEDFSSISNGMNIIIFIINSSLSRESVCLNEGTTREHLVEKISPVFELDRRSTLSIYQTVRFETSKSSLFSSSQKAVVEHFENASPFGASSARFRCGLLATRAPLPSGPL